MLSLVALPVFLAVGCASNRHETEMENLWKRGYGFNNPNVERIKGGQRPLNIDGTVSDRDGRLP